MCRTRIHARGESPLYEILGESRRFVRFWLKKGAEERTARIKWRRIEEVSRIFASRNAADAIYENVVREWWRKTGEKKKGHSRGSGRRGGRTVYFTEWS